MVNKKAVPDPRRSLMDFDKFCYAWTRVGRLLMHALVSTDPVPPDARAVVLVHGCTLSGRYMVPTASVLTGGFRVYVPDLPGFGDSDKPEEIFNVPELADWLVSWMRVIGLNVQRFLVISSDAKSSPIWACGTGSGPAGDPSRSYNASR
jgi:pimeloyl-ACP methyl ester carboxylesterase